MSARRRARELVLNALYQMDVAHNPLEEVIAVIRREAEEPGSLNFVEEEYRLQVLDFFEGLVRGVGQHQQELDQKLGEQAHHWSFDRLARVDRNLLRLGAFEILHRPDIPAEVAISEAVSLAAVYGDEKSGGFVNGLLDALGKIAGRVGE